MIFTRRSDYGLRAAMELAAAYGRGPQSARNIAQRGNLPEPFARKLLQDLSRAGLATSTRGRNGGYALARSPRRVTVRETLEAFETLDPVPCFQDDASGAAGAGEGSATTCALDVTERRCPTRIAWRVVDRKVRAALEGVTLQDLVREVEERGLGRKLAHDAE